MLNRNSNAQKKPESMPKDQVIGPVQILPKGYLKNGDEKPKFTYIG